MSAFPAAEYQSRIAACQAEMQLRGLDALLIFAQESQYYLFGYDGGGYVFFQCTLLTATSATPTLLCRRPDVAQARDTSTIDDIRIWFDAEDANPALQLRDILLEKGLRGAVIGVELETYGLTAGNWENLRQTLAADVTLHDASSLVRTLRLIKSPGEISLIRRAADLADKAIEAAADKAEPGVLDAALAAACLQEILLGGGDVPPAGPLVNSGKRAIYGRGVGGPRMLAEHDQVIVELAASFRRYNCCIERTIVIGPPSAAQHSMFEVVSAAMTQMLAAFKPGQPVGAVDDVHRQVLDAAGFANQRYAACGYSLGATYRPSWMDVPPMIFSGNALTVQPGMVFFPHVMLGDADSGRAVGLGDSVLITAEGAESLSRLPRELIVK